MSSAYDPYARRVMFKTGSSSLFGDYEAIKGGYESSDGWDDSDDEQGMETGSSVSSSSSGTPLPADTQKDVPKWTYSERFLIPQNIKLQNFRSDDCGKKLMRDESAYKVYPGFDIPAALRQYKKVFIGLRVMNSFLSKNARVPDIKTKGIEYTRTTQMNKDGEKEDSDVGIFINPRQVHQIHFKKKCLRIKPDPKAPNGKKKTETGFKLGSGFAAYVDDGVTPEFTFIAIPMVENAYVYKEAIRSEPFRVFSKRQDRFLPKNKRRRKNAEIEKMNTDIRDAEFTLSKLDTTLQQYEASNDQMETFFREIQLATMEIDNPTAKIALEYVLQSEQNNEVAML